MMLALFVVACQRQATTKRDFPTLPVFGWVQFGEEDAILSVCPAARPCTESDTKGAFRVHFPKNASASGSSSRPRYIRVSRVVAVSDHAFGEEQLSTSYRIEEFDNLCANEAAKAPC